MNTTCRKLMSDPTKFGILDWGWVDSPPTLSDWGILPANLWAPSTTYQLKVLPRVEGQKEGLRCQEVVCVFPAVLKKKKKQKPDELS